MNAIFSKFESIYPHLPVWAQNSAISLYGLGYRRERLAGGFPQFVEEFQQRDRWSADQMDDYQNSSLRAMILHAFDNVLYYNRQWSAAGIHRNDLLQVTTRDLAILPITKKADVRANPDAFVANGIPSGRLHRYNTSGSTGTPVTCICTSEAHRKFIAAREVRSFGWAGTSVQKRRSMLGGRKVVPLGDSPPPYHRTNWAENQIYFSAHHISPRNVRHYADALNRFQPKVMTGYAHSHYLLARLLLEQGLRIEFEPEALVLSSEKLTSEMKSVLHQAFHARAYEEYGSVENCVLATECSSGRLHISSDFGIVEVVDDAGRPVPPGTLGRLVCTGLLNPAQPLIRYEVGDRVALDADLCPCGRDHLPVLQEVVGRLEDVLIAPDGRRSACSHRLFHGLSHVVEAQLVQERLDLIRVRVVPSKEYAQPDSDLICQRIRDHLGNVEVVIETTSALPRTERGKFRSVISLISETSPTTITI